MPNQGIESPDRITLVVSEPGTQHPHPGTPEALAQRARLSDYALLLKPRVMSLVVFSGLTGLFMAPGSIDPVVGSLAILLIAVGAGASGAINMWYDRDIDAHMTRTRNRPIPSGRMAPAHALWVGVVLSVVSVAAMAAFVNELAAAMLAVTIAYYVFIYTVWLKRRTPQNIVIGGASGAFPPMIGWAAVTGDIGFGPEGLGAWVLFAIIFFWTPPHFWALALFRSGDYENAGVPMLPVVAGVEATKRQIVLYSALLVPVSLAPMFLGMADIFYGIAAAALDLWLVVHAARVWVDREGTAAKPMFLYSLLYLFLIFVFMLADKALMPLM